MKIKILDSILWITLFMSSIQFLRETVLYIVLLATRKEAEGVAGATELYNLILTHKEGYYLLLLILTISAGALLVKKGLDNLERSQT